MSFKKSLLYRFEGLERQKKRLKLNQNFKRPYQSNSFKFC